MHHIRRGIIAAVLLASLIAAAPAQADTVDVRIEGDGVSLERTVDVPETGEVFSGCPYDSAAGAIEVATEGDWDRQPFTSTILGESHTYSENDYWNFWFNREYSTTKGICDQEIADGDEVLMLVQRDVNGDASVFPLFIAEAPSSVERGQSATVRVAEHVYSYSTSTTTPRAAEGASVGGATTGSDGAATVTFDDAGRVELRATKASRVRSPAVTVTVTEPGQPAPPPPAEEPGRPVPPPCFTSGFDGRCGTVDLESPVALITSIREGAVFSRRSGPRELRGTAGILGATGLVPDGSEILMIKLRLTRRVGPRCTTWSPTRERFVPRPCGAENGFWFRLGDDAEWEYLLPGRLGRGRYVFDADAIDRAGNRLRERRRGQNRVVFVVR
jgi:hypothetical protein